MQPCNINAYSLQKRIFFDFSRLDSPVPLLGVWLVVGEGHHPLAGAAAVGRGGAGGGGGAQAGSGRVLARVPEIQSSVISDNKLNFQWRKLVDT